MGTLLYIALRDTGKLVGYYAGFVRPALHYKDCLTCTLDIIYVSPDSRGQKGGAILLNVLKQECIRRGVKASTLGCKEAHKKFMEKLILECDYKPFETHYIFWF